VSEATIGLTIIAVGTSLPELATSAVAAWKKNTDIAVGNVVGSNIFNVFWILGLSSIIKPLPFSPDLTIDVLVAVGATALLFFAVFIGKQQTLERGHGIIFVLLYIAYILYVVLRT
jgi:cation:H+ antiporter